MPLRRPTLQRVSVWRAAPESLARAAPHRTTNLSLNFPHPGRRSPVWNYGSARAKLGEDWRHARHHRLTFDSRLLPSGIRDKSVPPSQATAHGRWRQQGCWRLQESGVRRTEMMVQRRQGVKGSWRVLTLQTNFCWRFSEGRELWRYGNSGDRGFGKVAALMRRQSVMICFGLKTAVIVLRAVRKFWITLRSPPQKSFFQKVTIFKIVLLYMKVGTWSQLILTHFLPERNDAIIKRQKPL